MKRFGFPLVFAFLFVTSSTTAQEVKVSIADGGAVTTNLGYGITVNKGSTLLRSFVTLNDPSAPAQLNASGVNTRYQRERYEFVPVGTVTPSEPLSAIEVRYVLYGVFGTRIKTLSGTEVKDLLAGTEYSLAETGTWYAFENEVSDFLTAVSFVANARTATGKVWRFSDKQIGDEIAKLNLKVSAGALEPTKDEKK